MLVRQYVPGPPLRAFVRCFWYSEGFSGSHAQEKLLPSGEPSIVFDLRDANKGGAVLAGARSDCFVIDTDQQERVAGIQFRPGGAFPFFRAPASETAGLLIELEDLWPRKTGEMRERLLEARGAGAIFATLERCLAEQAVRPLETHPAVAYAFDRFEQGGRVDAVVDRIGFSSRRFIEIFRREAGLTPKTFFRVRRFQRAIQTIHRARDVDWVRVALDCGYYDQAHFIHDFRAFSGLTPGGYVAAATPHLNHVPIV